MAPVSVGCITSPLLYLVTHPLYVRVTWTISRVRQAPCLLESLIFTICALSAVFRARDNCSKLSSKYISFRSSFPSMRYSSNMLPYYSVCVCICVYNSTYTTDLGEFTPYVAATSRSSLSYHEAHSLRTQSQDADPHVTGQSRYNPCT